MKMRINLEALKLFWKQNTKGGVTVFICAVLIPVMIFTGFITDLARIKLYHSEAAGAAESYADAVMSQYDEMLYNVYGLLSVTQNEEGLKALDTIKEYMESAYDPSSVGKVTNASESSLKYIPNNVVFIGMNNDKLNSSWAPYGNTKMSLSEVIDKSGSSGANLSNKYIFSNQVCDYMKITGPVDLAWNGITDAIDRGDKIKENAALMNERKDVDGLYQTLDGELNSFYTRVNALNRCDEWEAANKAVSAAYSGYNMYNVKYANYIKLAVGASGSLRTDENSCELGELFNKAINALTDDEGNPNAALFETWKSEMGSGSISDNNYLYKICYIRVQLDAASFNNSSKIKYTNPRTGASYSVGGNSFNNDVLSRIYTFKKDIEDAKGIINNNFDEIHNMLVSDPGMPLNNQTSLRLWLDLAVNSLEGGSNSEGINSIASQAESKREKFVENCSGKTGNDMAQGLAKEYSFTDEGAKEMKFVGDFDYDWLKEKYQNNYKFIDKLCEYLEADRSYLLAKFDELETDILTGEGSLLTYLDSKIADLENYAYGSSTDDAAKWRYSYIHNVSSEAYISNLIFSDIDSVKKRLENDGAEWFKITNTPKSGEPKYDELWKIMESWYSSGGSSEKSEAKTAKYKGFMKELKKSISDRGDAGKELFEKFGELKIPQCINVPNGNGDAPDQSVASLFGDEGDFDITVNTEAKSISNYYLTKLLMMDYDWNFFTGATYGKHPDDDNSSKNKLQGKSLKGETITEKTNYLVRELADGSLGGAELEYIYWGNRDAHKNLKAVRNQIMVIRAVENFASTYTITEINGAINAIKAALAPIPIAALIVPPLIRAAIAMAETYMDLQALYEGKSITLYKSKLSHLTLFSDSTLKEKINEIFMEDGSPLDHSDSLYDGEEPVKFNYNQYVILVTMLFCNTDTIIERTQNLVELNMNHRLGVDLASAEAGDLKFRLSNASVAVTASCKIDKMNLLILGGVFNEESTEGYLSSDKREKMEKGFSYTIYRSY